MTTRRRKRRGTNEHVDESWLVPYADMLTLLFALFVILVSSSQIDADKYEEMKVYYPRPSAERPF